ncbi:hypothetical protein HJC10_09450 [Corallococcus exiguus]|nr:hypothetical protein [Corallococcus exiguus]
MTMKYDASEALLLMADVEAKAQTARPWAAQLEEASELFKALIELDNHHGFSVVKHNNDGYSVRVTPTGVTPSPNSGAQIHYTEGKFTVYEGERKEELPLRWHYRSQKWVGPVVTRVDGTSFQRSALAAIVGAVMQTTGDQWRAVDEPEPLEQRRTTS